MRNSTGFILIIILLISCGKDNNPPPVPGSLMLTEIRKSNSLNKETLSTLLEYDSEGRLIKVKYKQNANPPNLTYEISYPNNNTVIVRYVNQTIVSEESIYILDASGRPAVKYFTQILKLDDPNFQRSYSYDTTTFQYSADGFLQSALKNHWDSTYAPTTVDPLNSLRSVESVVYNNSQGNLQSMIASTTGQSISYRFGTQSKYQLNSRITKSYTYNRTWPMGNYGKNAFLYENFGVSISSQPIFLPYKNLASETTIKSESLDSNGNVTQTETENYVSSDNYKLFFNELNLLTKTQFKEANGSEYYAEYIYKN